MGNDIKIFLIIYIIGSIPFLYFSIRAFIKAIISVHKINRYNKAEYINFKNYTPIELKEVEVKKDMPRGYTPYFASYIPRVCFSVKQKKYTGNTFSGIRVPFFRVNIQNREFMDQFGFSDLGQGYLIITNQKIFASSNKYDSHGKKEIKIASIDDMELLGDDRSIFISERGDLPPAYFSFNSAEEATYVQNLIHTLIALTKNKKKNFRLDHNQTVLPGDPMSEKENKSYLRMRVGELREILSLHYYSKYIKKLTKEELIPLIEDVDNGIFVEEWLIGRDSTDKKSNGK